MTTFQAGGHTSSVPLVASQKCGQQRKISEDSNSKETICRLAKMPSGEPISAAFLSSVLPDGDIAPVVDLCLDKGSVIEGRHSTTFRLLLDRSRPSGVPGCEEQLRRKNCAIESVFVKRVTCAELPQRSLNKWRTSIASYRAEATFFKTLAGCRALRDIAPRAFWVHVNDRLGCGPSATPPLFQLPLLPPPPSEGAPGATENGGMMFGESKKVAAADAIEPSALRESSFMIVMEDLAATVNGHPGKAEAAWEQAGALGIDRARLVLTAAAHLHASFWPNSRRLPPPPSSPSSANHGKAPPGDVDRPPPTFAAGSVTKEGSGSSVNDADRGLNTGSATRSVNELGVSGGMEGVTRAPVEPKMSGTVVGGTDSRCWEEEKKEEGSESHAGEQQRTSRDARNYLEGGPWYPRGLHEQGTFWSLEKRDPCDLSGLEEEYQKLLGRFRQLLPEAWFEGELSSGGGGGRGGCGRGEASLGRRIAARARELDAAVHGFGGVPVRGSGGSSSDEVGERRSGRTLVHGDLKTWNVFFKKSTGRGEEDAGATPGLGGRVKFIDWQWCGEGLAAADVAYVICTSLEPEALDSEVQLLAHYHAELSTRLKERFGNPGNPAPEEEEKASGSAGEAPNQDVGWEHRGRPCGRNVGCGIPGIPEDVGSSGDSGVTAEETVGGDGGTTVAAEGAVAATWYPFEQFMDDYRVAFLDYMRCVLGTLWKGLSPEKMERNRSAGPGMSMINRSIHHLRWVIEKATTLADELDGLEGCKEATRTVDGVHPL